MSLFVKKLVEKASLKKPSSFSDSLKPDDVNPRLVFHYGILSGSVSLAYDTVQHILALATKDGQIKLFGADGSQALLTSSESVSSKFLQFIENRGVVLSISINNAIEVWDIDKKCLSAVHHHENEITSFAAMHVAPYFYVGDAAGSVSVLKIDMDQSHIEQMKYHIPLLPSHGNIHEIGSDITVKCILPHPVVESKRVLIIYSDGVLTSWGIHENKVISTNNNGTNTTLQSMYQETKKATAACWCCPFGTKVAVGYSNGDIYLWSVLDSKNELASQNDASFGAINVICKLNLGFKSDKIPILKLKWIDSGQKSSRLYALGLSDHHSANLLQVVLLNDYTESRTIKLGLQPPESLVDMEITTVTIEQKKHKHEYLLLLGRSNHVYLYDDSLIERYLIQCQNKSSPSLPKEVVVKLPYGDSSITVIKYFTNIACMPCSDDEIGGKLPLFPFERGTKSGTSNTFGSLSRARNLLVTGHSSGSINFWDASSPLMLPIASITQQSDNDSSPSGIPVTALHFGYDSRSLLSGDQNGMVRIYILKPEAFAPQNTFMSLQGSSKKGNNHIIHRIKVVKVSGAVVCLCPTEDKKHLAVGSDQGHVTLIDPESLNILYQKQIVSEFSTGIVSMHFDVCSFHGFEKNVLIVSSKDSSISTLEKESGNTLSSSTVRPKKPSKALFTQILHSQGISGAGSSTPEAVDINNINSENSVSKQSVMLLCSEKAAYVYSLSHLIQGTKKVLHKKKFNASCIWASTFGSPDIGLILLFASGKIEIRSLPELSLVKESLLRGLATSTLRPSSIRVSSSHDGEIIIVNGDQELLFLSTQLNKEVYRHMDSATQIFDKDLLFAEGALPSIKHKKKGIFSSIVQENKDTKTKNEYESETQDVRRSIEELALMFSTDNFVTDKEAGAGEEIEDIDIDDIDIDDPKEKTRGHAIVAGLNKKNIASKFNALKGKLKHLNSKNEKVPTNEEPVEEQTGAVDQIKRKYGYSSSGEATSSVATTAKNKLGENLRKLQGLSLKTSEMQDTARSFSSMAKEVLRFAENDKK